MPKTTNGAARAEAPANVARIAFLDMFSPEIREVIRLAEGMHRNAHFELIGAARFLVSRYPKIQGTATVVRFPARKRNTRARKGGAARKKGLGDGG